MDPKGLLPVRSIEDILAERVRLTIGGEVYDLPALPVGDSDDWVANLEADLVSTLQGVDEAGSDVSQVIGRLGGQQNRLLDALFAYDQTNVLPPRDKLIRMSGVTPMWVVRTVLEVWRAAHPLADISLMALVTTARSQTASSRRTSSRPRSGASRHAASAPN